MSTSTQTVTRGDLELNQFSSKPQAVLESKSNPVSLSDSTPRVLGSSVREDVPHPPEDAVEALERWNGPDGNMWRVFAAFWSFLVMGTNDGSYGALLPFVSALLKVVLDFGNTRI